MVAFEVERGLIIQSTVEPFWVIERFDVIEEGELSLVMSLEVFAVEAFGFKRAPKGLHGRIVIAVCSSAHAGLYFVGVQERPEGATGILDSPIGMVEEPGSGTALEQGLLQGFFHQRGFQRRAAGPAHDSPAVKVHDGSQVKPALSGKDVSDVTDPNAIGRLRFGR